MTLKGIQNIGNSCYMSAVLQILRCWNISSGVDWLYHQPQEIKKKIGKPFHTTKQQDAHEFLLAVLDKLNIESTGMIESTVSCPASNETSTTKESFHILSIPVTETLSDSIVEFQKDEKLTEGWRSPKMLKNEVPCETPTFKRNVVTKFPTSSVVLHLKRFRFDGKSYKINKSMAMPFKFIKNNKTWKLRAFIVHQGRYGGGHYVAFVFREGVWYCCNDSRVTRCDTKLIEKYTTIGYLYLYEI